MLACHVANSGSNPSQCNYLFFTKHAGDEEMYEYFMVVAIVVINERWNKNFKPAILLIDQIFISTALFTA